MTETPNTSGAPAGQPAGGSPGTPGNIDVQRLAEKVYQLMLADARLGRARNDKAVPSLRIPEV